MLINLKHVKLDVLIFLIENFFVSNHTFLCLICLDSIIGTNNTLIKNGGAYWVWLSSEKKGNVG